MYSERQIARAESRAGLRETPGQFRRTFVNLRDSNPELYEQKRAEQRDAYGAWKAQQQQSNPVQSADTTEATSNLAAQLAGRKMQQRPGIMRPAVQPSVGVGRSVRLPPVRTTGLGM